VHWVLQGGLLPRGRIFPPPFKRLGHPDRGGGGASPLLREDGDPSLFPSRGWRNASLFLFLNSAISSRMSGCTRLASPLRIPRRFKKKIPLEFRGRPFETVLSLLTRRGCSRLPGDQNFLFRHIEGLPRRRASFFLFSPPAIRRAQPSFPVLWARRGFFFAASLRSSLLPASFPPLAPRTFPRFSCDFPPPLHRGLFSVLDSRRFPRIRFFFFFAAASARFGWGPPSVLSASFSFSFADIVLGAL